MNVEKSAIPPLEQMMKDQSVSEAFLKRQVDGLYDTGWTDWFFEEMARESSTDPHVSYPSQGLLKTPHDGRQFAEYRVVNFLEKHPEFVNQIVVPGMIYFLDLANHPERINELNKTPEFQAPRNQFNLRMFLAPFMHEAISINEVGLAVEKADHNKPRASRTEYYRRGPFVQLGKYPRMMLVGSANPEVWGSAPAIAHMAESHCLAGIPRDGLFTSIQRQADLAKKTIEWLHHSPVLMGKSETERQELIELWQRNLMGVLETNPEKALVRAKALYEVGIRTFRVYSPEPGSDALASLKKLREWERSEGLEPIEIFVGQIVNVDQAKQIEKAGADGLYVGIGGGGRCITGERSGLVIDWPQLLWNMRGEVGIPIIVEGGASSNIGPTLTLGASGIGVTRVVAGGMPESPGGWLYLGNGKGDLYKPYGGEASSRVKSMGGREGPLGIVPYPEGETTKALMYWGERGEIPTLLANLYYLNGNALLAMVMMNEPNVTAYRKRAGKAIRIAKAVEIAQRGTH
jgi:hypothetical protein